jgi:hypothetical protein
MSQYYINIFSIQDKIHVHVCVLITQIKVAPNKIINTFASPSWRGVLDTTLCDNVCQWLAAGLWFSPGSPVSSTNKIDRHGITEMLLKVA